MKPAADVEAQGEKVLLSLYLERHEALALALLLARAVQDQDIQGRQAERWRGVARRLRAAAADAVPYKNAGRVRRPPASYSSTEDMNHVLYGSAPFPVLSVPDLRAVYPALEARKLSARQIAQRLQVHQRTVQDWRAARRAEGEG